MQVKDFPIGRLKAGPNDGLDEGEFLVYPSTFTRTPDAYGDVVKQGAFADTITAWKDSGNVLPGYFGHRLDDPDYNIAGATDMGEDEHGWWVRGQFDLDNPKARTVHKQVLGRRLNSLSFAFDVLDEGPVDLAGGAKANELRQLAVHEFSFVPIGANQDTSIVAVKQAAEAVATTRRKADEDLSEQNVRRLREAHAALGDVLDAAANAADGDDSDGDGGDGKSGVEGAKGAVGSHSSSTSDDEWDGPANKARLGNDAGADTYRKAFAWVDPDGDPDTKDSYKFLHHFVGEDWAVGAASTQACVTGIGVLNGGRGGTTIPDGDREGVHAHLGKHLRDADENVPDLKTTPQPEVDGGSQPRTDDATGATHGTGQPDSAAANDPARTSGSSAAQPQQSRPAQVDTTWIDEKTFTVLRGGAA